MAVICASTGSNRRGCAPDSSPALTVGRRSAALAGRGQPAGDLPALQACRAVGRACRRAGSPSDAEPPSCIIWAGSGPQMVVLVLAYQFSGRPEAVRSLERRSSILLPHNIRQMAQVAPPIGAQLMLTRHASILFRTRRLRINNVNYLPRNNEKYTVVNFCVLGELMKYGILAIPPDTLQ